VPLIRIPHSLNKSDSDLFNPIQDALNVEGYNTIFVFTGVTADEIESEFNSFEYNSLIFLRNVIETEISLNERVSTKIVKTQFSDNEVKISLTTKESVREWLVFHENKSSIAFSVSEENVVKLPQDDSFIHALKNPRESEPPIRSK
jgi:hypothetical protein